MLSRTHVSIFGAIDAMHDFEMVPVAVIMDSWYLNDFSGFARNCRNTGCDVCDNGTYRMCPKAKLVGLDHKREDYHYDDVKESLRRHGFACPLNADLDPESRKLWNGHHRLAAAIDLGIEMIPMRQGGSYWNHVDDYWRDMLTVPTARTGIERVLLDIA